MYGEYEPETLEKLHRAEAEMFKDFADLCERNKIEYFAISGTAIGAVRHQGFIPWDDDFDVVMLRDDYETFCDYCMRHQDDMKPYKLFTRKNEENYPYNIARLNNMDYRAVYENVQGYDSGVFIDIYPLDGAGTNAEQVIQQVKKKKSDLFRIALWSIDDHYTKSTYHKWYRSVAKYVVRSYAKIRGSRYFLDKMESFKYLYDIKKSRYIAEMTWDSGLTLYEKKWFETYVYMDFENLKVKVPVGYDEFLKCHYGDYMKLPPAEERIPHHEYKVYRR